jgi:transposase
LRRVIGMDIHRTFAEVVAWEEGRLKPLGRVEMTRAALEGFGKRLQTSDEVVVEATGNAMAVVRVLSPFVTRVVIANPLQVKAIAYAHVKTDKIDAGVLANLYAAGYLPEVWTPDPETSGCAVWSLAAIKSSSIEPGSKTRSTQSCMRT